MTVKIGINGFGRIGRLAFRRIFQLQEQSGEANDIEVAAINDLTTPAMLAYLLKYDSTHGRFRHADGRPVDVESTEHSIIVDGTEYTVYSERDARNIPWVKNDGVDYVLECTGFYTSAEKSRAHIDAGVLHLLFQPEAELIFSERREKNRARRQTAERACCIAHGSSAAHGNLNA